MHSRFRGRAFRFLAQAIFVLIAFFALSSATHAADGNLITNPSFTPSANPAIPADWNQGKWGTNAATFQFPASGPNGLSAVRVNISGYVSGDAKWYATPVPATPGTSYTYSDQYTASVPSSLNVQFEMTNGSFTYAWMADLPAAATWAAATGQFTAPAGAVKMTVFHLLSSNGSLSISQPSLTGGTTPPPPSPGGNLIANGDMSQTDPANANEPIYWNSNSWGGNAPAFAYPVAGPNGGKAARVTYSNYSGGDAKWVFSNVAVTPGTTYTFTDAYRASIPSEIDIAYRMSNGTDQYVWLGSFSPANAWTNVSRPFTVPAGVTSLTIFHLISGNGWLETGNYSLTAGVSSAFSQGMVTFSFDDGYLTTFQNALPILNAAGIKSTQYIISRALGTPDYVSADQVRQMKAQGHEIGDHTRTHPSLITLNSTQLRNEITGAKTDLENLGIGPVTTLAYPFGDYNATVQQAVKNAGLSGARSVNEGFNDKTTDKYALMDQHVENMVTADQIKSWIDSAIKNKTWLILELHQTIPGGSLDQYSNSSETLQAVVDYVKQTGVKTVTVSEGLGLMN